MTTKQEQKQDADAWRKLGDYFATPRGPLWDDYTLRNDAHWGGWLLGICKQLTDLPAEQGGRMRDAFREMFGKTLSGRKRDYYDFWWPREDRSSRALACYLMAEMGEGQ